MSENARAGLVRVALEPDGDRVTIATVTYDMTALSDEGEAALKDFAEHYEPYLEHWQRAIDALLA